MATSLEHNKATKMQTTKATSMNTPKNRTSQTPRKFPALLLALTLSASHTAQAMHHGDSGAKSHTGAQIAIAEQFIDAFYSFDPTLLAPILEQAPGSAPNLLYYQGWAEGGNYKIVNRGPCATEDDNKVACPITVQDDPVLALKTGFEVTDTFHLSFQGKTLVAVDTSSNDQPIYFEARKWVETNQPEVMEGPCKDRGAGGNTPGDCARAMTEGYRAFYETVVAPRDE
jgi:hypothetical protein